ncbi:glycosyltransferase, family 1 [Arcobacter acticola]|uniref:Glycosyltransferase, family 1 n=1 Tax=Arcobacter acticola TaxID=1849015 RepID=A0A6M8EN08_9BACT|nr:glycosyltransferase family 4 protein [Arcobacter acticola]QKE29479.1 glycosyltransferase, family 1 [Arcobacter acticola]
MKICQILAGNEDGGLEKHTIELSKQLVNRGFDVTVIAHEDFKESFENIKFIPLDLSKSRNNFFILFKLYKILKKENFDIIHTQANKATSMVTKIKSFINTKIVSTLHNYKKNLSAFEKSNFVITVSDNIGKNLKTKNKVTIYNGISFNYDENLKIDLYSKYNIEKDKFIICSVARLTKVKRFELILSAIKNLDLHLILVGSGEEENNLRNEVTRLNIENKVTFTGNLVNNEVKEIISSSSLFVMSSDNEGFPYTFVETMFCKTPFISTPVSDMEKLLGKKYITHFSDVNDLSSKIGYVKDNYNEVVADFQEKFDYAQNKFTIENMVNETISVYKKVLR